MDVLPEGTLIEVRMTVRLPSAAAEDHVQSWLSYNVAQSGSISSENPLCHDEPEAWGIDGVQWSDTGMTGKRVEFDHEDHGGGRSTYRVRYERTPR